MLNTSILLQLLIIFFRAHNIYIYIYLRQVRLILYLEQVFDICNQDTLLCVCVFACITYM